MRAAQPVALVIGNKTQAWGELVEHNGSLIVPVTQGMILVSKAYSVMKLTTLFVPGFIIAKHGQTLEWLNVNGGHAVVQTRTLRSRAPEPPHPATGSADDSDLGTPAPVTIPSITEQLLQEPHTHPEEVAAAISNQLDAGIASTNSGNDDDTDLMDESPEPSSDDLERLLFESIQHAQNILHQPRTAETLASRVLDDAYHFMDRLLRLISKQHPAYKEFAHLFRETIFIRHGEDEANGAINRRVRRYIPSPEKLVKDLLLLFTCFQNLLDADGKKFFTKDARKQAAALVETARLGFLSDPPGMAVYYLIGRDKNGLNLYRTVRGTNSVEGGVHKQIR
ncbi:hypothetical protein B0H11DRAFT_2256944 [Mycena galericulata]|nr:hypothetical protein B0H11DRAFT_2256944 [Mycena galericulata]